MAQLIYQGGFARRVDRNQGGLARRRFITSSGAISRSYDKQRVAMRLVAGVTRHDAWDAGMGLLVHGALERLQRVGTSTAMPRRCLGVAPPADSSDSVVGALLCLGGVYLSKRARFGVEGRWPCRACRGQGAVASAGHQVEALNRETATVIQRSIHFCKRG